MAAQKQLLQLLKRRGRRNLAAGDMVKLRSRVNSSEDGSDVQSLQEGYDGNSTSGGGSAGGGQESLNQPQQWQGAPIFEAVRAPKLEQWTTVAVKRFVKLWDEYVIRIGELPDGEQLRRSVKTCVKPQLRDSLAMFHFKKEPSDVSDEEFLAYCRDLAKEKEGTEELQHMKSAMQKALKCDMRLDVRTRITNMCTTQYKVLDDLGMLWYIKKYPKECVTMVVKALQPIHLRLHYKEHLESKAGKALKKDLVKFYDDLRVEAEKIEYSWSKDPNYRSFRLTGKCPAGSLQYDGDASGKRSGSNLESPNGPKQPKRSNGGGGRTPGAGSANPSLAGLPTASGKSGPRSVSCFHCKGAHRIAECPTASPTDKAAHAHKIKTRRSKRKGKAAAKVAAAEAE